MKLLVKVGGQQGEDSKARRDLARQICELRRAGHKVVLVHGGGKLLTEMLGKLGIPTEFRQGLRVTDTATRDVALMVLAGLINKQWVADLNVQGQPALGVCGGDGQLVIARKLVPRSNGKTEDLGFVGRPQKVNTGLLEMAFERGLVPVVASLALSARGEYLNVNADDLAAALAMSLRVDRLLYVTESGGVWDAGHRLLPIVRTGEIRRLIQRGVVRDGMIPKLLSCARTLRHEVGEIDIVSAAEPHVLLRVLEANQHVGTRVLRGK
ncbi:MAG TPA: acetylglutamate kinase [Terriglobia bacterium]|nr:acetylglutamate kinase [Terriglobia bacterium]